VHIGPSSDFSDIQAGMSGMRSKPAVPSHPVYVSVAAKTEVQNFIKNDDSKASVVGPSKMS
jgi:hypothetical protein